MPPARLGKGGVYFGIRRDAESREVMIFTSWARWKRISGLGIQLGRTEARDLRQMIRRIAVGPKDKRSR